NINTVEDGNHKKDQNSHFPMKSDKPRKDLCIDPVDQAAGGIEDQAEHIFSQYHKPPGIGRSTQKKCGLGRLIFFQKNILEKKKYGIDHRDKKGQRPCKFRQPEEEKNRQQEADGSHKKGIFLYQYKIFFN